MSDRGYAVATDPARRESGPDALRASDAEREATAKRLAAALSEGRLGLEEYDQRLSEAMTARTRGELVPLTADLPVDEATALAEAVRRKKAKNASGWREHLNEWRSWAGGAVIMVGIWGVTSAVSGELHQFWPAIPLAIWGLILIAGLFWPDDDDDSDDDGSDDDEEETPQKKRSAKDDGWG